MNEVVRIVRSGDEQVVPLPEGYRFSASEIRIYKEGDRVILEAEPDDAEWLRCIQGFEADAAAAALDRPAAQPDDRPHEF